MYGICYASTPPGNILQIMGVWGQSLLTGYRLKKSVEQNAVYPNVELVLDLNLQKQFCTAGRHTASRA